MQVVILFTAVVAYLLFLHNLFYAQTHCTHCRSEVMGGTILAFSFNTHHCRVSPVHSPINWEILAIAK